MAEPDESQNEITYNKPKTVVETVDRFNGETDIAKRDILEAGESVEIYLTDSRSLNISEKSGD